ncbi:microcin-processing peptidase 1 [Roseibium hamelinense]|uniref:Microcin-processing peptidase 1 n=1 Tax=Roseibium hamelinense TaxID=150831 RepID=A0A562T2Y2_9HYPH|nr:metallopeptidase TldD-related protein [Roseibium hamelinense]MTI42959.1 TldD/PmbA family protein [Roseibium hamelinense]TWI87604.1 microcin-processing peptidase 1 [Roseibium hamelinense]
MSDQVNQAKLENKAEQLVAAAKRAGADACDAVAVTGVSLGTDVRNGRVEETDRSEGDDFSLRVFVGKKSAIVSANQVNDPEDLAERAVAMAKVAPEDAFAGLADPDRLLKEFPELELLDDTVPSAATLTELALAAEEAAMAVNDVTKSGGASASWRLGGIVLATSHGFKGSYVSSRFGLSMTAIAGDGTAMERDYDFDYCTFLEDLLDPVVIGRRAGERAVRRINPEKVSTQTANVLYEARAARSLVGHLAGAINGASIARGTSFLKSEMGNQVFAKGMRITDDPFKRRGAATRPFDGEGTASPVLDVIDDGVLTSWFLDGATGRELGLEPNGRARRSGGGTSPGSTNLTLSPGKNSPEEMMKSVGSGLLVTDLIGQGVNGVTGDYSRGASGFWFENGEIVGPVSEITIAGNLKDMFARMVPANDLDDRYSVAAPSILIEGLTLAGS